MRPRGRFKCKNNALGTYIIYKNNFDHLLIELSYYFVPTVALKKERSGLRD